MLDKANKLIEEIKKREVEEEKRKALEAAEDEKRIAKSFKNKKKPN